MLISLYIHLHFCRKACWFCGYKRITAKAGSKAVTPYLITEENSRLWDAISKHFPFTENHEGSIDINLDQLSQKEVQQLRNLGFKRISFGLKDVECLDQKAVNRVVSVYQLRAVMVWMRAAAFESVNEGGSWLVRVIAAAFDPDTQQKPSGSRLV